MNALVDSREESASALARRPSSFNCNGDRMHVARGEIAGADAVFTGSAPALAAAVYGGVPFDALAAEGALTVEGDRALAERFTTLFPLPPKVERS